MKALSMYTGDVSSLNNAIINAHEKVIKRTIVGNVTVINNFGFITIEK